MLLPLMCSHARYCMISVCLCVYAGRHCLPVFHLCQQVEVCHPECSFSLSGPVWNRHLERSYIC